MITLTMLGLYILFMGATGIVVFILDTLMYMTHVLEVLV